MSTREIAKAFLIGGAVITFWGVAPGCGPSAGSYCNKVCDCTGCSDSERTDCIDTVDDARDASNDAGCDGEFAAYFSCVNAETTCAGDKVEADGCEAEADALTACGATPAFGGDPCQRFADHITAVYTACGIDIGGGEQGEATCTPEVATIAVCLDPCVDLLTCEFLTNPEADPDASKAYSDCVNACL